MKTIALILSIGVFLLCVGCAPQALSQPPSQPISNDITFISLVLDNTNTLLVYTDELVSAGDKYFSISVTEETKIKKDNGIISIKDIQPGAIVKIHCLDYFLTSSPVWINQVYSIEQIGIEETDLFQAALSEYESFYSIPS